MVTGKILIAVVILCLLICCWWLWNSQLDEELAQAQLETAKAEEALVIAQAYTKTVQEELNQAVHDATAKIETADKTISWLQASVDKARTDLQKIIAEKRMLLDEINTLKLEDIPDAPMPKILGRIAEVYPYQDLSGVEITGNAAGRGLFQLMLSEIETGRELVLVSEKIQEGHQEQIYRLEMVIDTQESKMLAMGKINHALSVSNEALLNENAQHIKVTQAQADQLNIYEQKIKFNWMGNSFIAAGAALAIVVIIW